MEPEKGLWLNLSEDIHNIIYDLFNDEEKVQLFVDQKMFLFPQKNILNDIITITFREEYTNTKIDKILSIIDQCSKLQKLIFIRSNQSSFGNFAKNILKKIVKNYSDKNFLDQKIKSSITQIEVFDQLPGSTSSPFKCIIASKELMFDFQEILNLRNLIRNSFIWKKCLKYDDDTHLKNIYMNFNVDPSALIEYFIADQVSENVEINTRDVMNIHYVELIRLIFDKPSIKFVHIKYDNPSLDFMNEIFGIKNKNLKEIVLVSDDNVRFHLKNDILILNTKFDIPLYQLLQTFDINVVYLEVINESNAERNIQVAKIQEQIDAFNFVNKKLLKFIIKEFV